MAVETVCCPVVPGGDGGMATMLRRISVGGNGGTVALACRREMGEGGQRGVAMASVVYPSLSKANAGCVSHLAGSMGGRAQEVAGMG